MKWSQYVSALLLAVFAVAGHAQARKAEVIEACRGEGCGCFQAYRDVQKRDIAVPTVRPFTVRERMDDSSRVLGRYKAGVYAKPGKQFLLINEAGEHVVTQLNQDLGGVKVGDHLTVLIGWGEGQTSARQGKKTVEFESDALVLKTLRETQISDWMEVSVRGMRGYTREQPFEGCLE
jgi:hypothetical protein